MDKVFNSSKNFIFVGESGCGKTEIALNFSLALAGRGEKTVLFDMDQTKPLFRAREAYEKTGLDIRWEEQLLDTPVVPPAVRELLMNKEYRAVMDVGGNALGVHMIGQYKELINRSDCSVFFVLNPFRILSDTAERIADTYSCISAYANIRNMKFVLNPNFGESTKPEDIRDGAEAAREMFPDIKPAFMAVTEKYAAEITELPVLPLRRFFRLPWEQ